MKKSYNGVLLAYRFWRKRTLLDGFFNWLRCLELCVLWCTWEWNHITDVTHTCYEEQQTLKAETET